MCCIAIADCFFNTAFDTDHLPMSQRLQYCLQSRLATLTSTEQMSRNAQLGVASAQGAANFDTV